VFDKFSAPIRVRLNPRNRRTNMKTKTTKTSGLKVTANVKAGGLPARNHNQAALRVKSGIKAGPMIAVRNHNLRLLALG
jgi:hypothetical protein